ncbi:MAG: hypothetical protein DIU61_004105 [Bacteroidota bacterium]|jgi:hypothetical protein|nr:MAG: hypothetical protein DIU61_12045 [Bacteroidota bacterium]
MTRDAASNNEELLNTPTAGPTSFAVSEVVLPPLTPSRYEPITRLLSEIDVHGQQLLRVFFNKAFSGYFELSRQFPQALLDVIQDVNSSILQVIYEDRPRKEASLMTIKKRFFAAAEKLVDQFNKLLDPRDMKTGIHWYVYRLQKDLSAFPVTVSVTYKKEDFKIKPNDSPSLKWLKFRRNLRALLSGGTVRARLHYREAMQYYMRDGRFEFLLSWLEAFRKESLQSLTEVEAYIAYCDKKFDTLFEFTRSDTLTVAQWEEATRELADRADALVKRQDHLATLFFDRLLVEFRLNIDHLRTHLEQIDANYLTRIINSDKALHRRQRDRVLAFADEWRKTMGLAAGRISLDTTLRELKWQIDHDFKEFRRRIDSHVTTTILEPVGATLAQLDAWKDGHGDSKGLKKLEWKSVSLLLEKDFKALSDRLMQSSKSLPDTRTVLASIESSESTSIPVRRLVQHYLEYDFLSPLHDEIDRFCKNLKDNVVNMNDQLSLTLFSIDNSNADDIAAPQVIANAIDEIRQEESAARKTKHELSLGFGALAEKLFEAFSVNAMVATSVEFGYISRDARQKKVISRIGNLGQAIRKFFVDKILILIYSRSEGIRIARQIASRNDSGSVTDRVLEVISQVTPDPKIISALPHYYLNLFSGRSNIGEAFWIVRESDDRIIAQKVHQYLGGRHGGILITGERNAGKTAICRRIAEKHFAHSKQFHLFPPADGSARPEDFLAKLQETTGVKSDLTGIMNSLPHHTVVVIHDLELWWERTPQGMQAFEMIMDMIAAYSDRIVFIANMNPFAAELIHAVNGFKDRFIGVMPCSPMSSMELKNLILTRHRSSGLEFALDNVKSDVSEIALARLFNDYFNYTEGNPGVAMNAWLSNIVRVEENRVVIRAPRRPDTEVLDALPPAWNLIILQLILHKRMSEAKLLRVFRNDFPDLLTHLRSLVRAGLIGRDVDGCYGLNNFIEPFVIRVFKQKDWL